MFSNNTLVLTPFLFFSLMSALQLLKFLSKFKKPVIHRKKKSSIFISFQVRNPEIRMFLSVISNLNKGNGSGGIESRTKHSYKKEKEIRMSPLPQNCEQ